MLPPAAGAAAIAVGAADAEALEDELLATCDVLDPSSAGAMEVESSCMSGDSGDEEMPLMGVDDMDD